MTATSIALAVLLTIAVVSCWLGALGVWRMRDATQSLHYLTVPAAAGTLALAAAVFIKTGNSVTSWKVLLIAALIFAINSVGTHASARAFRARQLGHWEPRDGDPMEWVRAGAEEESSE